MDRRQLHLLITYLEQWKTKGFWQGFIKAAVLQQLIKKLGEK